MRLGVLLMVSVCRVWLVMGRGIVDEVTGESSELKNDKKLKTNEYWPSS